MLEEHIPGLRVNLGDDDQVWIEQDFGGNISSVSLHRIHLRYLAEKLGLAPATDARALKTITQLERRLRVLRERIDFLDDWLLRCSDTAHADLSFEQTYSSATLDIATEFCADLDDLVTGTTAETAPHSGALPPKHPQKRKPCWMGKTGVFQPLTNRWQTPRHRRDNRYAHSVTKEAPRVSINWRSRHEPTQRSFR